MPSRTRKARRTRRDVAGESVLTGLFSLSAARLPWIRATPRREAVARSALASLFSLSAARLRRIRRAPRREAVARSALASLFSLSAAKFPWIRRAPMRGELKAAIMAALAYVDHYEDRNTRRPMEPDAPGARSVGLSYQEILRRVRARYPDSRVSILTIRSYARDAKQEGWAMPYRRPQSTRRRLTGLRRRDA